VAIVHGELKESGVIEGGSSFSQFWDGRTWDKSSYQPAVRQHAWDGTQDSKQRKHEDKVDGKYVCGLRCRTSIRSGLVWFVFLCIYVYIYVSMYLCIYESMYYLCIYISGGYLRVMVYRYDLIWFDLV
jgi:hypothetical protein